MPTINLPDNNTAEIRDPQDVRRGDVRAVAQAMDRDLVMSAEGQRMQAAGMMLGTATAQDVTLTRFIRSWTLVREDGTPLPITLDVIQDLPMRFYKPLAAALAPTLLEVMGAGEQEGNGQPPPLSGKRSSKSAPTA